MPFVQPPPETAKTYTTLLEQAILSFRMRLRYGEEISLQEIHDLFDALHNVPQMLRNYGGWHVETNIDGALELYDRRWMNVPGSERRDSLLLMLDRSKQGFYDDPYEV